jgi:hypothetical protein
MTKKDEDDVLTFIAEKSPFDRWGMRGDSRKSG